MYYLYYLYIYIALHFAAAYGYSTIARHLLEAGADLKLKTSIGKSVIDLANDYKKFEVFEVLESASTSKISPKKAANAFLQNVETETTGDYTRNAGSGTNEDLDQFFKVATSGPDSKLMKFIKEGHININAKSKGDGRTALHRASDYGSMKRVKMLLDSDAYMNDVDVNEWTALMFAAARVRNDIYCVYWFVCPCSVTLIKTITNQS